MRVSIGEVVGGRDGAERSTRRTGLETVDATGQGY